MFASHQLLNATMRQMALFCVSLLTMATVAMAHEGPPFPIMMDQPLAGYMVSVWTDPDIGEARFFIVVESHSGRRESGTPQVSLWVEPVNGRLDRVVYAAKQQSLRGQTQFVARPYFDQRDLWNVGIRLTPPGGETQELTTQVESTPPGYGPWDFAIYLFPFGLVGVLWVVAMVRRSRAAHTTELQSVGSGTD